MITFSFPYTTPTLSLTLPNPQLGNAKQMEGIIIYKKTMSGDLHTTVSPHLSKKYVIVFELLTNAQVDGLITFIKTARATAFRYTDHENVAHKCKLPMSNLSYSWVARYSRVISLILEVVT